MSFNLIAAVIVCGDFEVQENKNRSLFPFFPPSICHEVMGPDAIILAF